MGRQRSFLPPPLCQQCGKAPQLGQTLWPADKWRCVVCLEDSLPGKDSTSKSMHKTLEYAAELRTAFDLEDQGLNANESRNRAAWARSMALEIEKQGMACTKNATQANGEVIPRPGENPLYDTMAIPDLAAVDASLQRSRLLLYGIDVAAMALDAANSIQATNSMEKMLAHQLAAVHKVVMELLGLASCSSDGAIQTKRLIAASKGMAAYQQGLLTLRKFRQNGNQRIMVQYVNVSDRSQAPKEPESVAPVPRPLALAPFVLESPSTVAPVPLSK